MTRKTPVITGMELVKVLERAGFEVRRQKGSHLHMFRDIDRRRVTIPVHNGKNIPMGTLKGIVNDADISVEQLRDLLK